MLALIYTRISKDRAGAGLGVDRQREDCQKLADSLGWTVVETFSDNDISAFSGKRRPAYEAMLAALDAGKAQAVIAWHTDRLHRKPMELEGFIELCEDKKSRSGRLQRATWICPHLPEGPPLACLGSWHAMRLST
ncbi:MAG: recombinase family protein [[Mycobacterium] stephanolepidis]